MNDAPAVNDAPVGPVSDEDRKYFNALTCGRYSNFALLAGRLNSHEVGIVVALEWKEGDRLGETRAYPIAVMWNDAMNDLFSLTGPDGSKAGPIKPENGIDYEKASKDGRAHTTEDK